MKKKISQKADYGIYIDHAHCIMVASRNRKSETSVMKSNIVTNERFKGEGTNKTRSVDQTGGREKQHQNKFNNEFKRFCKSIVEKIHDANRILIMGPSDAKFELQKEIRKAKELQGAFEKIRITGKMSKGDVMRFVKENFAVE